MTKIELDSLTVRMDGKEQRSVSFSPSEFRQFDHGFAVTSPSSQGLTANRVIAHFDTDSTHSLINNRLAYVAISRVSEDARIYIRCKRWPISLRDIVRVRNSRRKELRKLLNNRQKTVDVLLQLKKGQTVDKPSASAATDVQPTTRIKRY